MDDAAHQAHEVVGWYGDPTSTWGIAVELEFTEALGDISSAGTGLVRDHPWLGSTPTIEQVREEDWESRRAALVAKAFAGGQLVRIAQSSDRLRLLIGAHHGVCDGLGLVAIADLLSNRGLTAHARGIGARTASQGFLRSGIGRLREALFAPPPRFRGTASAEEGERVLSQSVPPVHAGTTMLCHRLARSYAELSGTSKAPIFGIGASRRTTALVPDRQTAFLRVRVRPEESESTLRRRFASIEPEPDFPESSGGGIGPLVTRLLRHRLGSTALISNLGLITGAGLKSVAMYPSVNGPAAVAIGFASTELSSTLSVRVRASDFTQSEAEALLASVVEGMTTTTSD